MIVMIIRRGDFLQKLTINKQLSKFIAKAQEKWIKIKGILLGGKQ